MNFGILTAEIRWRVWGTPANFNEFRVVGALLHWRRSTEVNKTLQDVWPSPGLVGLHYIYIFGGRLPLTEFCQLQNSLCVQVLRAPILTALLYGTLTAGYKPKFAAWCKEWNYGTSAGRPLGWASAHILLYFRHKPIENRTEKIQY